MPLGQGDRHAWGKLEASLHKDFPDAQALAQLEDPWTLTVSTAACRALMPKLILVVGVAVILVGALTGVPLFVITGIVILCSRWLSQRKRHPAGGLGGTRFEGGEQLSLTRSGGVRVLLR
ncbi:hypothetical protein RCH21_000684 [Arthrobacter sp. PL16]|uniref:DUF3040 domain-containing protein n=1 Tax=Arthrobacter sp. PL16 TaxID=3071720 RepID=UPI002DF81C16|nr:hypothetical protein [Arthrobacter sp. PL16]